MRPAPRFPFLAAKMDKSMPHILIVDDDPEQLALLSDILKRKGFTTACAQKGGEALAHSREQHMDVALIDLRLEDMAGMEVLRGIKQYSPDTECILLTGYASQVTAIEAINLGAYAYFQKPCDMEQLLVAIQRAGEKRLAEQALAAIDRATDCLRQGDSFLVFPEGTRSRTDDLLPFKKGSFVMAVNAQVPIVPVAITGGRAAMAKGSFLIRPVTVRVRLGEPVDTAGLTLADRDRLIAEVRGRIERMLEKMGRA